ncbi:hypothetical protein QLQ12_03580 [Actinoplanes sp. NEAU-A12]|uniref:DUF559 domain-containing protein n=1 Tax=Actinoplanes sandaracinus TaxID=3045177 RepID=A0ABT6WDA3_9ACTN|nr:hypothetical protein [Actinoplanes sandaracinus]MDI6097683.1 hypothetical protein [Actinoplanes sandaracinus]
MVERRLSSGRWQAPHRGVYVTHTGPLGRREARWIAILGTVAGHTAHLAGLSALETLGFRDASSRGADIHSPRTGTHSPRTGTHSPRADIHSPRTGARSPGADISGREAGVGGLGSEEIHVLLPARTTVRHAPDGVIVHRTTLLRPADLNPGGRLPATSPARSLLDAAQWQPSERRAWAIVAAGFQQRLVRADGMRSMLAAMPRLRHRRTITEAIACSAEGAHSLPEADFLALCRRAGLPAPVLQHPRRDRNGRQNYLDAYFPDQRLHVEIDGGHHMDVQQWWADMHR